jgi:hypothetical protein
LAFLVLGGACLLLIFYLAESEWRDAVAEADRLDPGWTFDELEAARASIPDEANSALCAKAAHGLLPAGWPPLEANPTPANQKLDKSIRELLPLAALQPQQLEALSVALEAAKPALDEARRLKDLPRGRYPLGVDSQGLPSSWPANQQARTLATLLGYDTLLRAHTNDVGGALESCRALLNLARSFGDEPDHFAQLTRLELRGLACRKIERVLAQGEPSAADLASLERLLEDEEPQPLFLHGARGFRAWCHRLLEAAREGELRNRGGMPTWAASGLATNTRSPTLRATTRLVEIAKLPVEKQAQELRDRGMPKPNEGPYLARIYIWPKIELIARDLSRGQVRSQAELRCTIAAIAAERYRRAKGEWPESLAVLVRDKYLAAVPADPFDGQLVRYRRLNDGVVIYCVGPDGVDDGGKLDRGNSGATGGDIGIQLWDIEHRRAALGIERLDPAPVQEKAKGP